MPHRFTRPSQPSSTLHRGRLERSRSGAPPEDMPGEGPARAGNSRAAPDARTARPRTGTEEKQPGRPSTARLRRSRISRPDYSSVMLAVSAVSVQRWMSCSANSLNSSLPR